jgi:hypothetical protein
MATPYELREALSRYYGRWYTWHILSENLESRRAAREADPRWGARLVDTFAWSRRLPVDLPELGTTCDAQIAESRDTYEVLTFLDVSRRYEIIQERYTGWWVFADTLNIGQRDVYDPINLGGGYANHVLGVFAYRTLEEARQAERERIPGAE